MWCSSAAPSEGPLQAGSVNARMAQLFVLDVLFQEFCMRAPEETEQSREQIADGRGEKTPVTGARSIRIQNR